MQWKQLGTQPTPFSSGIGKQIPNLWGTLMYLLVSWAFDQENSNFLVAQNKNLLCLRKLNFNFKSRCGAEIAPENVWLPSSQRLVIFVKLHFTHY